MDQNYLKCSHLFAAFSILFSSVWTLFCKYSHSTHFQINHYNKLHLALWLKSEELITEHTHWQHTHFSLYMPLQTWDAYWHGFVHAVLNLAEHAIWYFLTCERLLAHQAPDLHLIAEVNGPMLICAQWSFGPQFAEAIYTPISMPHR